MNSDTQDLAKKIEAQVDHFAVDYKFNGNILVAKGGHIFLNKSYGFADFENKVLNTPQTRFLIASMTKQFTATSIMQLQEKSLLSVEDNLDKYMPGFPSGNEITIHQLLTHTSGLPRDIKFDKTPSSRDEAVELLKSTPLEFVNTPGKSFSYSNLGYALLGYIIEKVSGKSYPDYIQTQFFTPLKMTNSGLGYDRRNDPNLALSYRAEDNTCLTAKPLIDSSMWYGATGIYSTTEDLYKWDRALYTEKLLSKKSLDKMFTPNKRDYGYGWNINKLEGKTIYFHNGSTFGFRSIIIRRVDEDICIIALSNRSNFEFFEGSRLDYMVMEAINTKS